MDLGNADVRERLLTEGPIGEWVTLPGTHTVLMHDVIRFDPDGTGETYSDSVLGGETTEHFTWSTVRPGLLACTITDTSPGPGTGDEAEPEESQMVGFKFERHHSDVGTFWVMRDPDFDAFWNLALPVVPHER